MKKLCLIFALVSTFASASAFAQATRTWVSGVGDDVNPCSRTAPCKTFAGAISKTASGGIIDALDPGGFGAVTITKPITIEGTGTLASVLASGTQGIVINITSGTNRDVVLRDILVNGAGTTLGTNGINFIAGDSLSLEHCAIQQFSTTGVLFQPNSTAKMNISDSWIYLSAIGVRAAPVGAVNAFVNMFNTTVHKNGTGVRSDQNAKVTIRNSAISGSSGDCVFATSTSLGFVMIDFSTVSNCGTGLHSDGGNTVLDANNNTITSNSTGVSSTNSGQLCSANNNRLESNGAPGAFNCTITQH